MLAAPAVEYFIDDLERTDERPITVPLEANGRTWTAVLPPQPGNSIVRYRFVGRRGGPTVERLSPRPSDPNPWFATFVNPALPATRTFQLFVSPANWTQLWTNIGSGPNTGPAANMRCQVVTSWDQPVPAVFVSEGNVYDVLARYQGSRFNRRNGNNLASWSAPGPSQPAPLRALSWRLAFPRYRRFEGDRTIVLNKQWQTCPGFMNALESKLLAAAGVPAQRFSYARLHINGAYYQYVAQIEATNEEMMARIEGPGRPIGDLFKDDGATDEQGPWGRGDFSPLAPHCGFTPAQRYQTTYERETHGWKNDSGRGHDDLIRLIEDLAMTKPRGNDAVRAYFAKYFDIPELTTLFAVRNWAGVWDDVVHNMFFYKRASDGKWLIIPQDFDLDFGGDGTAMMGRWMKIPPSASFLNGEEGNATGLAGGGINQLKSAFIRAYRPELTQRLIDLSKTVLAPDNVLEMLDQAVTEFSMADWMAAPLVQTCDVQARIQRARTWGRDRHVALSAGVR